jgi:integration host factor subunit alpha
MSGKTVNRTDLCQALYQKVGLSRTESATLLELVLKEITDCLERGETVKLSSFGSFVVRKKGQRMGRNPRTGEEALISPRRIVMFKPSDTLKQLRRVRHFKHQFPSTDQGGGGARARLSSSLFGSRRTAGAAGFLTFTQQSARPDR